MLIKQTNEMTERERIAVQNSNNQFLQALSYVAVGTIFSYAGKTAPETFMFCDGRALDITEYAELFEVIGYTFGGSGDIFNLPNLCGKTLVGLDDSNTKFDSVGKTGGEAEVTLNIEHMPRHSHKLVSGNYGVSNGIYGVATNLADNISSEVTMEDVGENLPYNNMPPYLVCNYIIKVANGISKEDFRLPINQTYNPESENAQSGKAVAEAISSNIQLFQVGKQYKAGDVVIGEKYVGEVSIHGFFKCKENHIATFNSFAEDEIDYYWEQISLINGYSAYEAQYNLMGKSLESFVDASYVIGKIDEAIGKALEEDY